MAKVTIDQFNLLSESEKHLCLFGNSIWLASKNIGIIEYKLYSVYNFFVEYQYIIGCKDIKMVAFKSIKNLDLYLNDIQLPLEYR